MWWWRAAGFDKALLNQQNAAAFDVRSAFAACISVRRRVCFSPAQSIWPLAPRGSLSCCVGELNNHCNLLFARTSG